MICSKKFFLHSSLFLCILCLALHAEAQEDVYKVGGNIPTQQTGQQGSSGRRSSKIDSLEHRTGLEDSINLFYRFWDKSKIHLLDSSINDFKSRFPIPNHFVFLGNTGAAAKNILFSPNMQPGWDEGLHAFDIYAYTVENTKFFQASRPFTEFGYILSARSEQFIDILHTQNIKPLWNFAFQYRYINAPGEFQNQKTAHGNTRFSSVFQSRNRKYGANFVWLSNTMRAAQNGGLRADSFLKDSRYADRFLVPTVIGPPAAQGRDIFNSTISTGIIINTDAIVLRQQFDIGQKDSLKIDTSQFKIFYPRLRLQHTFRYANYSYRYIDENVNYKGINTSSNVVERQGKKDYTDILGLLQPADTIRIEDKWTEIYNEFSISTFPDKQNTDQFLRLGAALQNLTGNFDNYSKTFYNLILLGEYRNRTRNQKWDIEASGQFYLNGLNTGDYTAKANLQRFLSKKLGSLTLGFQNTNRTPSFVFDPLSSFIVTNNTNLKKENITHASATISNAIKGFELSGDYYLVTNYTYFDDNFRANQDATLFNLLRVGGKIKVKLSRRWNLYSELYLQQTTANAPVHVPFLFSMNRIAYEGLFFKNLNLSMGAEVRFHTAYKADGFSPVNGQFVFQDKTTIANIPDINLFLQFRIRGFKGFLRGENVNSFEIGQGGLSATNNNFAGPLLPMSSFMIRFGVYWNFVN